LRDEDANIAPKLRESAEEAFLAWRCDLRDVERHNDDRCSGAYSRQHSSECHDADVGTERFKNRANGEEDG
jgi:hypothetical protein